MVDREFIDEQTSRIVQYVEMYMGAKAGLELQDQIRRILNQVANNERQRIKGV